MRVFLLGILLAAMAMPVAAEQSKPTITNDLISTTLEVNRDLFDCQQLGNIVEVTRKRKSPQSEENLAQIDIHLEYDDNYSFKSVSVVDENGEVIQSLELTAANHQYADLKDATVDVLPGTYTVVGVFKSNGHTLYHITENVVVTDKESVTVTPAECTNEISFQALNGKGERFIPKQYEVDRYGNETETGYQNCYYVFRGFAVYVNNRLFKSSTNGYNKSTIDKNGNVLNGESDWTVCLNNVSSACGVVGLTQALTPEGTYVVSMPAEGCESQLVVNDYENQKVREVNFVPSRNRRSVLNSQKSVKGYAILLGFVEGSDRYIGVSASFHNFTYPTGHEEELPEILPQYIFSQSKTSDPSPLRMTTEPSSQELYVYECSVDGTYMFSAYVAGQAFITPDIVKLIPSIGFCRNSFYAASDKEESNHNAYNDNYEYDSSEPISLGGNVPILTFGNQNAWSNVGQWAYIGIEYGYIGRYGERRECDNYFTTATRVHADQDGEQTVSGKMASLNDIGVILPVAKQFEKINMTFHNDNIMVDDMIGVNDTEINYYCDQKAQYSPLPVLRMLQIREGNKVTDRITNPEEATLNFSVGNFKFKFTEYPIGDDKYGMTDYRYEYWDVPFDVKVEYAPYGSGNWREFRTQEIEDEFQPVGWGKFFTGNFGQVDVASPNEWYDLRISIIQDENNNQMQTLSPAFKLGGIPDGIEDIISDTKAAPIYYNLQGVRIDRPVSGELIIEVSNGKSVKKIY